MFNFFSKLSFSIVLLFILGNIYTSPVLAKNSYSIAIYGDSMVDTMGEQLEYLQAALKRYHPNKKFYFYNYGIGSQNVLHGLERFYSPFTYKTRNFSPISSPRPDIIIIGSFAYNPFFPHSRDQHWLTLTKLVKEAKTTGADVYMLAEIAPLGKDFGKGPNGVNLPDSKALEHANRIVELLENAIYLSRDHLKVPLIDTYTKTRVSGKFGSRRFTSQNDGIHPSMAGHKLMAELIAVKIKLR